MTQHLFGLLCLIGALLLGGCSDYSLHLLPPSGTNLPSGGSSHTPPPANNSLWGSLEPGEFPEALFATVWNNPKDACLDCWILNRYEQPRYDIIDAQGKVAVHFELPWEGAEVYPKSIQPAGPGRFLAVSTVVQGHGSAHQVAWFGDGQDGEVDVVLEWNTGEAEIYVPEADRILVLPETTNEVRIVPDPQDPDRLYLLARLVSATESLLQARLYSIDVRSPEEPILEWYPEELLHPSVRHLNGAKPWYPWFIDIFDKEGQSTLVIGMWSTELGTDNYLSFLVGFSPDQGPNNWHFDLTETGVVLDDDYGRQIAVQPPSGKDPGQAILHTKGSISSHCHDPGFSSWNGSEAVEIPSAEGLDCMRIGPLLEPSTSTFLYYGLDSEAEFEAQERLVISHRGTDIWSYSSFRDGLVHRPFDIHDLVSLETLEQ